MALAVTALAAVAEAALAAAVRLALQLEWSQSLEGVQLVSQGPSFAGCLRSLDESWGRAGLPRTLLGCAGPAAEAENVWQAPLQASQAHHWLQVACLEAMVPALAPLEP